MIQPMVVGYKGEIGLFILNGLLRVMPKAKDIWCSDINETKEEVSFRIKQSDVIFLCVPLSETIKWLMEHRKQLKGKLIVEQCSLKEWLYTDKLKEFNIRSMHILFRPSSTPNLPDRRVGLFEDQWSHIPEVLSQSDIRKITQSEIVWYKDAKAHDKDMAIQQALLHRSLLVLDRMLVCFCGGSTYISQRVSELADRIRKGNLELYTRIQQNPYEIEVQKTFIKMLEQFDINKYWDKKLWHKNIKRSKE